MASQRDSDPDLPDRVRTAVADAGIGRDELFDDLVALDALDVAIERDTAHITVTLPVPDERLRRQLERKLQRAAMRESRRNVEVSWTPSVPDPDVRVDMLPDVASIVAVSSGKGGVGKSTVAANLAVALADTGAAVGLLDADIYGPNAPQMLGVEERTPRTTHEDEIIPWEAHGVRVMSMGFVAGEDDPVIWRGPMVDDALEQLFRDVHWGELDYLVVDLPPGTGDAQLTLVQHLPVTGTVVVTTPQPVAVDNARRGLRGFARYGIPILGIAENMAGFQCPDCGSEHDLFDAGGADSLAAEFDVPVLGRLPLDPAFGTCEPDDDESSGVSIPLIGRLQLPRTRGQRERETNLPPIAVRDGAGPPRRASRRLATRTAARINALVVGDNDAGEREDTPP